MGKSTIYVYNESNILLSGWWLKNHLETYEFVNVKDDIPYMKWNIKAMFETTNQIYGTSTIHYYYH